MIVRVGAGGEVTLAEPGDVRRLSVEAADGADAGAALAAAGIGEAVDDAHVAVDVAWIRGEAAGHAADADLDAMFGYAASKGWLTDDGARVRAHLA